MADLYRSPRDPVHEASAMNVQDARDVRQTVARVATKNSSQYRRGARPTHRVMELFVKTPTAGIPPTSGTTIGSATGSTFWYIDTSTGTPTFTPLIDQYTGIQKTETVYNFTPTTIAGGNYVLVKPINNLWIAVPTSASLVFYWTPSSSLGGANGAPGSMVGGSPATPGGSASGQTVYQLSGGAFVTASTNATITNGLMATVVSGKTCIVEQNPDGTFSTVSQSCT
jgi:hypothetical protein